MTWNFKDTDRWFDFRGFLFGKGFKEFNKNPFEVIKPDSLKVERLAVSCDTFKVYHNENEDDSLEVTFSGDIKVGEELVEEYKGNIPEDCRNEITKVD